MIWHSASLSEVLAQLETRGESGLAPEEAARRLGVYGENRLAEQKGKNLLQRFLDQFKNFMVIILLIAAVVSCLTALFMQESWLEPIVIIAIVILNALLGVIQESRAENALAALKTLAAPSAKVVRGGSQYTVQASELVPGDVILLEAGDYIPADARVIESAGLRCEESALTGESVSVEKFAQGEIPDIAPLGDRFNMVYTGCSVAYGRGRAVVTETGMHTEMGKIAVLLENSDSGITPLQHKLAQLGKSLGILALVICAVIFVVGFLQGPEEGQTYLEKAISLFMTSVSLAVAAIPEGLPAIVTIVLAIGVQRMVKKNAIIRHLPAVETLGSASVICSDKTGTLTQNRMTLVKVFNGRELRELSPDLPEDVSMLLRLGAMCCDGRVELQDGREVHLGDPTETAIVAACMRYTGLDKRELDNIYPRLGEIPFDSSRKLMTTVNLIDGKPYAVVKGAPDVLMARCATVPREAAEAANAEMGRQALRVLAVAIKPLEEAPSNPTAEELEHGLTFVGLVGMIDPPRPEAARAVEICRRAGVRTVMITGDHVITATAIARQLGMLDDDSQAITGAQLEALSDEELFQKIEHYTVYARVSPEDKIRIVKTWQKKGQIVAMTGDGVNDAPALKAADIGCAMGITGTDVAKGAADMTLTDDNFATIVTAVSEGRGIFDNIRKAVHFLLSCNLGEILSVFFAMLFWKESPLLPVQLLWINLVTDGAPALALGMEPVEKDVMHRGPRKKDESVFAGGLGINALWQGVMFCVLTVAAYALGRHYGGGDHRYAQTMAFAVLAFSQIVHAFNVRSNHSLLQVGLLSNRYMPIAAGASVLLMLLVLLTPVGAVFGLAVLNSAEWLEVILLSLSPLVICELVKLATAVFRRFKSK